ncbi:MAG: YggS family pyridoxal phosphate-dependent enzyme [Bdellovibrionaceae bacterium]|nr:YggS family pyridoxal phosphate-dependent enzyme [Pseudobdellovibrionaceae bacterium]MBX3032723.1 YggS family pyridoxal phosphate-dependent enzyme [Pseudobdellovibrionaceae bacterium]
MRQARQLIEEACRRAGREASCVRILAVSKRQPVEKIVDLSAQGQDDFGENYVQELAAKMTALEGRGLRWHLIGHLQKNKIKLVSGRCALIHSVDSLALAEALNRRAGERGLTEKILLQVNVGEEITKEGFSPEKLRQDAALIFALPHLEIQGLMTMPPLQNDAEQNRPFFRRLRELAAELRARHSTARHPLRELSMGTSHDFVVAVEEGATLVRLGTVLFGERAG